MKKVKVRVAVAVDPSGDWNATGWKKGTDVQMLAIASEIFDNEACYWLEADLDVPEAKTVEASVTQDIVAE